MTKQQPFAARLRLSRICRWLLALCALKLCLLGALTLDVRFPALERMLGLSPVREQAEAPADTAAQQAGLPVTPAVSDTRSPDSRTLDEVLPDAPVASTPAPAIAGHEAVPAQHVGLGALGMDTPLPEGAAAARAATRLTPSRLEREQAAPQAAQEVAPVAPGAAQAAAPAPAPSADATAPAGRGMASAQPVPQEDTSWWANMLQLKSLPFPKWSVQRAAHAATLDTPPPPTVASAPTTSPFAPPAQNIPQQSAAAPQGPSRDAAPRATAMPQSPSRDVAPRAPAMPQGPSRDAAPRTTAMPQSPSRDAAFVPNAAPPTPNINTYTPPEDPNRRQQELARREQEVLMLQQQMEQRLKELNTAEKKMQSMLQEAKAVENKKVKNLVNMYTNMKPKTAAKAIESLDERVAVKILTAMTPKQCGDILSYTNPKVTAKLTELISRMRMGQ